MKRKFISFTNDELDILENALKGQTELLKQIKKERQEREHIRKMQAKWEESKPKVYCC